ncbi:hypothetical protein TIFTF001_027684 [Ficus carica]|uniref:galactinol--sucrose galactosyltransferase n=1 Tax=Ficus carica TaxID=3494 RepID=A0AA88AK12_FICCA|nr:hypothetical protein TIFTF001_025996 [Ficus carica]GMN58580.1 hypothetical protein TIFTF001_027684 [Ficus carica]
MKLLMSAPFLTPSALAMFSNLEFFSTTVNELELCAESGDPDVQTSQMMESVFMNSGDNPYKLMKNSIKILEKHKRTFHHIENKTMPKHIDCFGWSTWDAFYTDVTAQGIEEGLKSFSKGGYSPRFLIIDDGWLNTVFSQVSKSGGKLQVQGLFLGHVLYVVYAWHALLGYWGGVLPTSPVMQKYNPELVYPVQSPGNLSHILCTTLERLEKQGIGLIEPSNIHEFYEYLHSCLASCGIDGVKSNHYTADFHGAARAIGGCSVYVSDETGQRNFHVIKKLVLPDGSILRARCAGRPTRDCLFVDPVTDNKSLLKIWNMNKFSGIIGVFICQRAGKWPPTAGAQYVPSPESGERVMPGSVRPLDVDSLEDAAVENWSGDCAIYLFNSGSLVTTPKEGRFEVSLRVLKFEFFTVCPIREAGQNLRFAPIGLLDMYNSGGAVQSLHCRDNVSNCVVKVEVQGCGRFGAYSSRKPKSCSVDTKDEIFSVQSKRWTTGFQSWRRMQFKSC